MTLRKQALVGGSGMNGYSVSLALRANGFNVTLLDHKRSAGCYSIYSEFKKAPNPATSESELIEFLLSIGNDFSDSKTLIFPTNDEWVDAISANRSRLANKFWFVLPEDKVVRLLLDKLKFATWVKGRWSAPKVYTSVEQILSYPVVAKPVMRRKASQMTKCGSHADTEELRILYCDTRSSARYASQQAVDKGITILFQELLPGDSRSLRSVGVSAYKGQLLGYVYGAKLRGYPIQFGDTIVGEIQAIPPKLLEWVKDIISELDYSGIAEIEFIYDVSKDSYHLLEINPRSWSWFGVARPSGICLISLLMDAVKGHTNNVTESAARVPFRYMKLFENIANFLSSDETKAGHWSEIIRDLKTVFKGRGIISGFERFDPIVNLITLISPLRIVVKRFLKK